MENIEVITLKKNQPAGRQGNIKNFADERNKLLLNAKRDWVLFLDSDEKLNFKIQRKTYFLRKFIGNDYPIRLVKKGSGKWVRRVHEYWEPYIIHNTANNLKDYIKKINFYSDLHARSNRDEKKSSSILKIIFFPLFKFFYELVKTRQIVFSIMQAFHSFLSWSKLYFLRS